MLQFKTELSLVGISSMKISRILIFIFLANLGMMAPAIAYPVDKHAPNTNACCALIEHEDIKDKVTLGLLSWPAPFK